MATDESLDARAAAERAAWSAHNVAQLRYFRSLSLRAKMEAVQGMADVVRRFKELRRQGRFTTRSAQR